MEGVNLLTENETGFDGTCFCTSGKRRVDARPEKKVAKNCGGDVFLGNDVTARITGSLFPPNSENLKRRAGIVSQRNGTRFDGLRLCR
jgi:hypothetical protein